MDAHERSKQAAERQARDLRSSLSRQAADARRSIGSAERTARSSVERQGRAAPASGGSWFSSSAKGGAQGGQSLDDTLLLWALPVAALAALPLVVGHLAALLVNGGTPSYPPGEIPGILGRLLSDLGDPGGAWEPVNTGTDVPGPVAWWGTFLLVLVIGSLIGLLVWAATRTPGGRSHGAQEGWARVAAHRDLWVARRGDDRLVVGTADGHKVGVRDRHSLLVVGAAHSGKSSGLVIPSILEWKGPVVVAATKGHVIDETIGWRSGLGEVHVYDPAGVTPYERSEWSLLADCATWQGAIRTAADLTLAVRGAGISDASDREIAAGQGDLWRSAMAMALAPYLLAAVSSGKTVAAVSEWIQREERDEVLNILQGVDRAAARAHASTLIRTDESRAAFLHAMHNLLRVYEDPVVAESADLHEIVPAEVLDGEPNTLYLTAPEHDQARFRPFCSMIVRRLVASAFERSARLGRPLDPPLLVVLDDVLTIAPIYDLASLASTAPVRGVQLVSVVSDVDQITARYGDQADAVVRNHGAKVVLSGRGSGTASAAELLPADLADHLRRDEAALLSGDIRPLRIRLRPWFRDRELTRRVQTPQDAVRPVGHSMVRPLRPSRLPRSTTSAAAWLNRSGGSADRTADEAIPLDKTSKAYLDVFGTAEDDTLPQNVTPLPRFHRHEDR